MDSPTPTRRSSGRRQPRASETPTRGQALAEFALILPIMILLLLVAIDFGRLYFSYVEVTNAAREAAAYVAIDPTVPQASIASRAGQEANTQTQGGEGALTVNPPVCQTTAAPPVVISCSTAVATSSGTGNQVTVAVSRPFTFLTPIIGGMFGTLTMTASATSAVYNPAPTPAATPAPTPTPDPCAIVADFTFSQSKKNKPVVFSDASTPAPPSGCAVTAWLWDFGDGSTGPERTSITQSRFSVAGDLYTVTLKVSRSGSSDTFSQPVLTLGK